MPSASAVYNNVLSTISSGNSQYPVTSRKMENGLHISGSTVRDAVRYFRRRGEPIIATESGYYIATKHEEVKLVISDLTTRISSMSETIRALQSKAADRFGAQETFRFQGSDADVENDVRGREEGLPCPGTEQAEARNLPPMFDDNRYRREPKSGVEPHRKRMAEGLTDQALIDMLAVELTV